MSNNIEALSKSAGCGLLMDELDEEDDLHCYSLRFQNGTEVGVYISGSEKNKHRKTIIRN